MKLFYSCLVVGVLICIGITGIHAADYLVTETGKILTYSGQIKIEDDVKDMSMTIEVLEPYERDEMKWTVHKVEVNSAGQKNLQFKFYEIREDGIYCVAESKKSEEKPDVLDKPYMVLPIPPQTEKSWKIETKEGSKKTKLTSVIQAVDVKLEKDDRTFNTIHIISEGTASAFGMDIPTKRESWHTKELGMIRQVTTQVIMSKKTTAELNLVLNP